MAAGASDGAAGVGSAPCAALCGCGGHDGGRNGGPLHGWLAPAASALALACAAALTAAEAVEDGHAAAGSSGHGYAAEHHHHHHHHHHAPHWGPCPSKLRCASLCVAYVLAGAPLAASSARAALAGRLDVHMLTLLAAMASLAMGLAAEGALLLVLFQAAHLAEGWLAGRAQAALAGLMAAAPDYATVLPPEAAAGTAGGGQCGRREGIDLSRAARTAAADVAVGQLVLVRPGEQVPVDGVVVWGAAGMCQQSVTGEPHPLPVAPGQHVPAGAVSTDGAVVLRATARAADSSLQRTAGLARQARAGKPRLQRLLDDTVGPAWAAAVLAAAAVTLLALLALGVPLLGRLGALYRAMGVLVAGAPCALHLVPLAYACAMAAAAREGVLLKGAGVLDALCGCTTLALDKTGTITTGILRLAGLRLLPLQPPPLPSLPALSCVCSAVGVSGGGQSREAEAAEEEEEEEEEEGWPVLDSGLTLRLAAALSRASTHPVSRAVVRAAEDGASACADDNTPAVTVSNFQQVPGAGVRGVCEVAGGAAYRVSFGSAAFVRQALPAGFHLPVQQPQPQPQPLEQPALDDVDGAALQQQLQGQGLGLGLEVGPKASAVLVAVRLTADEAAGAAAVGKGAPGAIAAGTHGAGEGGRSRRRRSSSSSGDDSGTSSVGSAGLGGWPSPRSLLGLEQQQGSGKRRRRLPAKGGPIHSLLPPAGQGAGCCSCCGKGRMLGAAAQAVTVALLEFSDDVQLGAALALQQLAEGSWQGGAPRPSATKRLVMLTGDDDAQAAADVARAVGIAEHHAGMRPADKLAFVSRLVAENRGGGGGQGGVLMMGDGVNDAPALAAAHVGVAVETPGGNGGSSSGGMVYRAADVVLVGGRGVACLPWLLRLAARTRALVRQNLALALLAMAAAALPSLAGALPLWVSVLLHEGSTLLVALNSLRLLLPTDAAPLLATLPATAALLCCTSSSSSSSIGSDDLATLTGNSPSSSRRDSSGSGSGSSFGDGNLQGTSGSDRGYGGADGGGKEDDGGLFEEAGLPMAVARRRQVSGSADRRRCQSRCCQPGGATEVAVRPLVGRSSGWFAVDESSDW